MLRQAQHEPVLWANGDLATTRLTANPRTGRDFEPSLPNGVPKHPTPEVWLVRAN